MKIRSDRAQLSVVFLVAGGVLSGVQGILPALPAVQAELNLGDSEVALVTSLYFLPSVLFAAPLGFLADRVGRRVVISVALVVFGTAGAAMALGPTSLGVLLAFRFIQGAAVAAILPLTITLIGDLRRGPEQVASQGHRSVAMFAAEAAFPVVGGAMVAISWSTPFALQAIGLPLAIACWLTVPDLASSRPVHPGSFRRLITFVRQPAVLALQGTTFTRFFFKFAFLTYLPVLLVNNRGMTESFAGIVLGVFAISGLGAAAIAGPLVRRLPPSRWIGISLLLFGTSLILLSLATGQAAIVGIAVAFGIADGLFGVFVNSLTAGIASIDLRAPFVATSGMVRNTGKFLAPAAFGLLVVWLPLEAAFVIVGAFALAAMASVPFLRQLDHHFQQQPAIRLDESPVP